MNGSSSPSCCATRNASSRVCTTIIFFFQAEDGRRDNLVTGVQTCALPISINAMSEAARDRSLLTVITLIRMFETHYGLDCEPIAESDITQALIRNGCLIAQAENGVLRSEERRVGKECRSRWWAHHEK